VANGPIASSLASQVLARPRFMMGLSLATWNHGRSEQSLTEA